MAQSQDAGKQRYSEREEGVAGLHTSGWQGEWGMCEIEILMLSKGLWRFGFEAAPEPGRQHRFGRDVFRDASRFVAPVNASFCLDAVPAQDAYVALDGAARLRGPAENRQRYRELEVSL